MKFYTGIEHEVTGVLITASTGHPFSPSEFMQDTPERNHFTQEHFDIVYINKLRDEYRANKALFTELPGVRTFLCNCGKPSCHRFVLAKVLQKIVHEYGGDRKPE